MQDENIKIKPKQLKRFIPLYMFTGSKKYNNSIIKKLKKYGLDFYDIENYKYIVCYSGRWGGKTVQIATSLILRIIEYAKLGKTIKILCVRKNFNSLEQSVWATFRAVINNLYLAPVFKFVKSGSYIKHFAGSVIMFKGVNDPNALRSIADISILWCEEAQEIDEEAFNIISPGIRGALDLIGQNKEPVKIQFIFSLNPMYADDYIYKNFIAKQPPKTLLIKSSWRDLAERKLFNGEDERLRQLEADPIQYKHIWEGELITGGRAILSSLQYTNTIPPPGGIMFIDPAYGGDDSSAVTFVTVVNDKTIIACGFNFPGAYYNYIKEIKDLIGYIHPGSIYIESSNPKNQEPAHNLGTYHIVAKIWHSSTPKRVRINAVGGYVNFIKLARVNTTNPAINEANRRYNDEVIKYTDKAKHDDAPDSLASALSCLGLLKF